jgi:hypothetical protein
MESKGRVTGVKFAWSDNRGRWRGCIRRAHVDLIRFWHKTTLEA